MFVVVTEKFLQIKKIALNKMFIFNVDVKWQGEATTLMNTFLGSHKAKIYCEMTYPKQNL